MKDRKGVFFVITILIVSFCCVGLLVFRQSPYGVCIDLYSGNAPDEALERFIIKVIDATLDEDYDWLESVSNEAPLSALMNYKDHYSFIEKDYSIERSDDLGGGYEINVVFSGGTLHVALFSQWPECPDFDITEEEIDQNIRLINVK